MIPDRDFTLINHILDAIAAIELFVAQSTIVDFAENDLIRSAVVKKFEVIGEAANRISQNTKDQFPSIPWRDIVDMRNLLIHDYVGIDYESVWNTIEIDLPVLKKELEMYKY